jgi:hypothetical protein
MRRYEMIKITPAEMKAWIKERDAAVSSLDVDTFRQFYEKWEARGIYDQPFPKDKRVAEIAMYKMAMEIRSIRKSVKDQAYKWLNERGYKEGI